ncbi:MAG: hypothetical protein RBR67_07255 [Desulfobacterium sp.]|jgi:hypothetical protein|nr:hypothetical protein [Desulfobacterium sp.]
MVEGIGSTASDNVSGQIHSEYGDVQLSLKRAFPGKSELEIQQAVVAYLGTVEKKDGSAIDSQAMIKHIGKMFNAEISTRAANEIKTEWEKLTARHDIGVSELASILTEYSPDGINKGDREYLVLLWQMLQGELEDAFMDESTVVANANKDLQKKEFDEFVEKKAKEMEKAGKTNFWNKLLKWVGVVASVIAAVVACVVAAAAIATGVGAAAGALLIAGAAILVGLAVSGAVSATLSEFDVEWSLGQGIGKMLAKLINALGGDVDEETVAKWTAFAVQIALTVVAIACTLGAGLATAPGAVASTGSTAAGAASSAASTAASTTSSLTSTMNGAANALKMMSAGLGIATGIVQGGTAIANYSLSKFQAELLELKALLEQLSETRNMEQELMGAILSKIFEAMRSNVADSMDIILQDLELIAGMNLNKA